MNRQHLTRASAIPPAATIRSLQQDPLALIKRGDFGQRSPIERELIIGFYIQTLSFEEKQRLGAAIESYKAPEAGR